MGKIVAIVVAVLLVGGGVAFFLVEGRYMVEGGRAPWAVVNDDLDMLRQAIEDGAPAEERQRAFDHAVGKARVDAMRLLAESGVGIDRRNDVCYLAGSLRWGRPKAAKLLLELGADPSQCQTGRAEMMADAIRFGRNRVPERDLIFILSKLYQSGVDLEPARKAAGRARLERVAAYLEDPSQAVQTTPTAAASRPRGTPGSVQWEDLKTVCEDEPQATAAPYEKQAGAAAPVAFFERRFDKWVWPGVGAPGQVQLPRWWFAFREPADTQLVACVDAKERKRVKECRYEGPGGGISVYDATWQITVREAKTGRVVDQQSFAMQASRQCDVLKHGRSQEGQFPYYGNKLKGVLAPLVGGPS